MKTNVKRMMGMSALALTMAANMSMAAFAAEQNPKDEVQALRVETVLVEIDEATGTTMMSHDDGKTWNVVELQKATPIFAAQANQNTEMTVVTMTKLDKETGEMMMSTDGGKTWEKVEAVAVCMEPAREIGADEAE